MEGTKLLSELLAGVGIAWTQECCSSTSCGLLCCTQLGAGVCSPLGSVKQVSERFTGMQGWGGNAANQHLEEENPLVPQTGERIIALHALPAKE